MNRQIDGHVEQTSQLAYSLSGQNFSSKERPKHHNAAGMNAEKGRAGNPHLRLDLQAGNDLYSTTPTPL